MRTISFLLSAAFVLLIVSPGASGDSPSWNPKITQVFVDDATDPPSVMIIGQDLLNGSNAPSLTLGEFGDLTVTGTPTDILIEATLPPLITAGDFRLTLSSAAAQGDDDDDSDDASNVNDEYDLTISEDVAVLQDAVCSLQARAGRLLLDSCARKLVFLTSGVFQPRIDFRGLADADQICQSLADSASLPGIYKAWLSDSKDSPSNRFVQSTDAYALVNGIAVAENYNDLTDGALGNPINVTQTGATISSSFVWTNTRTNGAKLTGILNRSCNNWTTNFDSRNFTGPVGQAAGSDATWTGAFSLFRCDNSLRFYCFEQ